MKIAASYLSIKDNFIDNLNKLDNTDIDYIHVDVMDGLFVSNKTDDVIDYLMNTKKSKDVHLMVNDVKSYVDKYIKLNPEYITFHFEVFNTMELICYIKSKNIKVGLAIKPETNVDLIKSYLPYLDQVLVMSVEPGLGGQEFIENSVNKVKQLKNYRTRYNYNYVISIDGGINSDTIKLVDTDMAVVGSFITKSDDYSKQLKALK